MTERWKAVPGYEGMFEVSDLGRFKRLPRVVTFTGRTKSGATRTITHRHAEVITVGNVSPRGYCRVRLADELRFVHDLVLTTFDRPRVEGEVARHLNGQQRDNRFENLRWGTQQENADDSARHGTRISGSAKANAKLSDRMIPAIRIACGRFSQSRVAKAFGVSRGTILQIVHGRTWAHVDAEASDEDAESVKTVGDLYRLAERLAGESVEVAA